MNQLVLTIVKAIKEQKWLYISYENSKEETTFFWIAIKDIDIARKAFVASAFNQSKMSDSSTGVIQVVVYFDQIKSAEVVEGTTYDIDENFLNKLENEYIEWFKFDSFDHKLLSYYRDCIFFDQAPYQKETSLVSGIDENALLALKYGQVYVLSLSQVAELSKALEKMAKKDKDAHFNEIELVINLLSIYTSKGLFVVAYKKVLFNAENQTLKIHDNIEFNYSFIMNDADATIHNLRNYLDVETDYFTELFQTNREEAKALLSSTLRRGEKLDDKPYLFNMIRSFNLNIQKEFDAIEQSFDDNALSAPLDAFFGNMSMTRLGKKSDYNIILLNDNLNVDQLRVIHNALKNPVTYVQGPPGTGKTQSIINLLISLYFNDQTALISSNNNKPIDDIYEKLHGLKYQDKIIPLPILRLGNADRVNEAIDWIKNILESYKKDMEKADISKIEKQWSFNQNSFLILNSMISDYEERIELIERQFTLKQMIEEFSGNPKTAILEIELNKVSARLEDIPVFDDKDMQGQVIKADRSFKMWLYYTSLERLKRLYEPKFKELHDIINMSDKVGRVREFNKYIAHDTNLHHLISVFPLIMTTNQSAPRLGSPKVHFDLTIIDEAGQCSIGHSLFPIIRGKKLLLVGDQNQLQPVVTLNPNKNKSLVNKYGVSPDYNYLSNSILKVMTTVDSISKFILLRFHYRSHPKIINFSNKKYYKSSLIIESNDDQKNKALYHIEAKEKKHIKSNMRNVSKAEAIAIIEDIKENGKKNVGIITPFRNQAELIGEELKDQGMDYVTVGTIHTFQGDEKETIYLSACVTPHSGTKTFDWVKNNQELINVATTRAKKEFVVVGDYEEIKKRSKESNDYLELFDYTIKNGEKIELTDTAHKLIVNSSNYRQYNTTAEKELLDTIKHFLSFGDKYRVQTQVKVSELLNRYTDPIVFDFGLRSYFDFVLYKKVLKDDLPLLVIELDGPEHLNNPIVQERDRKKEQICKDNNIKIIRIPNDYSRRYVFVKEQILNILK